MYDKLYALLNEHFSLLHASYIYELRRMVKYNFPVSIILYTEDQMTCMKTCYTLYMIDDHHTQLVNYALLVNHIFISLLVNKSYFLIAYCLLVFFILI